MCSLLFTTGRKFINNHICRSGSDEYCIAPANQAVFKLDADLIAHHLGTEFLTFPLTSEYTSRCPTLLWDVSSSMSNSSLTCFCKSLVPVRFHSSLFYRGHIQYENIVCKGRVPSQCSCYCATHLYTFSGSSKGSIQ